MKDMPLYDFLESLQAERFAGLSPNERGVYRKAIVGLKRAGYRTVRDVAMTPDEDLLAHCQSFGPALLAYTRELIPASEEAD